METYIIMLVPAATSAKNMEQVDSAQAAAFKSSQAIDWPSLPRETKGGVEYHRLVAFQQHLQDNLQVKLADISTDKAVWTSAKTKGVVVLVGNDWRKTLDDNGYSEVKQETSK